MNPASTRQTIGGNRTEMSYKETKGEHHIEEYRGKRHSPTLWVKVQSHTIVLKSNLGISSKSFKSSYL